MSGVSIIIPVLNEAAIVAESLREVPLGDWEVIVVDGGSRDGTVDLARAVCEARGLKLVAATLESPSVGRTVAAGVPYSSGETLLVLPCDCRLSREAIAQVEGARCGGFAKTYFPAHWSMMAYAFLQNLMRSRWRRHLVWTNGIFFPRATPIPQTGFLEDVLLSDALRKEEGWRWIPIPILVSARRYFPRRAPQRMALNFSILALFRLGVKDFTRLKRLYLWLR